MCLDKIERSNFLRFLCLFIDIGTETLLTLFLHFVSQENVVSFFLSDDVQRKCKDLQSRKILTKKQLKIISHSCPDIHTFDISLFIVLLSNLFSEKVITPPKGGWETNRPRKNDQSLAANIVRMRLLRNKFVGHSSRAKLSDIYFQELWEELKGIVVSIHTIIDTKSLDDICGKVESYKTIQLDAQNERHYEDKLRNLKETCIDIVEMQEKVADLLQKSQEFAKFFRCKPKRFSRYVNLLFDGGRFVLRACLQRTLYKLNLDIHTVLSEKSADLNKELGDGVQQLDEAIDEWNVQALTTVMLVCFGDTVEPEVKEAIAYIQESLRGYARLAVESLDAERFSHIDGDLVYNLRILSLDLGADIQSKCKEMIDIHRKSQREENNPQCEDRCFDLLKSHGLKLKSLEDVYKETLIQLREEIKKMDEKGIPFKNDYVLQLQLMTYGEKKKMAEDILTTVITAALQNDESTAECEDIRKAIDLILAHINKISGVKVETVERHCILISISCSSSLGVSKLIEHIDGTYFQEQLYMLSSELISYFGEELVVSGNFNFETLQDLAIYLSSCCRSEHEPGGLTLPVTCSSAEGMNQLLTLMTADATTNSLDQIAEQLSVQLQDKISLEVDFPDLREFIRELGDNGTKMSSSQKETDQADTNSTNITSVKDTLGIMKNSEISDPEALPRKLDEEIHNIYKVLETRVDKIETMFNDHLRKMDESNISSWKLAENMQARSENMFVKALDKLEKTFCEKMEAMEKRMESKMSAWRIAEKMQARSENKLEKAMDTMEKTLYEKMAAMEKRFEYNKDSEHYFSAMEFEETRQAVQKAQDMIRQTLLKVSKLEKTIEKRMTIGQGSQKGVISTQKSTQTSLLQPSSVYRLSPRELQQWRTSDEECFTSSSTRGNPLRPYLATSERRSAYMFESEFLTPPDFPGIPKENQKNPTRSYAQVIKEKNRDNDYGSTDLRYAPCINAMQRDYDSDYGSTELVHNRQTESQSPGEL